MEENQKDGLIRKLADSRENINLLLNMIKKEQWSVEQKVRIAAEAKRQIDDILFELTGDEFYRNTGRGGNHGCGADD